MYACAKCKVIMRARKQEETERSLKDKGQVCTMATEVDQTTHKCSPDGVML